MEVSVLVTVLLGLSAHGPEQLKRDRFFVLLESGRSTAGIPREQVDTMQAEHIDNLVRLNAEGQSPFAGPLGNGGKLRGIVVLELEKDADHESLFAPDPFVRGGHLVPRVLPWDLEFGEFAKITKDAPMVETTLALLHREDGVDAAEGRSACTTLLESCRDSASDLDDTKDDVNDDATNSESESKPPDRCRIRMGGTVVDRSPDGDFGSLCGVLLFTGTDRAELEARLAAEPEVGGGLLNVELFSLWLGEGAIAVPKHER